MKKVLIITTEFPPSTSCGRYRPLKFAKFLSNFGWTPVVLTRDETYIWDKDWSLMDEIPKDITVYRAFYPDHIQILTRIFSKNKERKSNKISSQIQKASKRESSCKRLLVKLIKIYESFLNKYVLIPDNYLLWLPFALYRSLWIIKKEKIDIIFTTIPAFSLMFLGYFLKLITKKPWVVDYRDLWSDGPWHAEVNKFRGHIERMIERKTISKANRIVVVSKPMIKFLKQLNSDIDYDKFCIIPNGFDLEDFPSYGCEKSKNNKKLTITYTGSIEKERSPYFFLKALGELLREKQNLRNEISAQFIGKIPEEQALEIKNLINEFELKETVKFIGYVPHKDSLSYQMNADVLLLIIGACRGSESILTGKLFEYLVSGKLILALVSKCPAMDLILRCRIGIIVEYNDIVGIKVAIGDLYQKWQRNGLKIRPNWEVIKSYDRKVLTKQLAKVFNEVIQ